MKYKLEQFLKDHKMINGYPGNGNPRTDIKRVVLMFKESHKQHLNRYSSSERVTGYDR